MDVILRSGGPVPARAAKNATTTIPIVFIAGDPIGEGLVASLARPNGNLTGVSIMTTALMPKRIELLTELVPEAKVIALLVNPNTGAEPSACCSLWRAMILALWRGLTSCTVQGLSRVRTCVPQLLRLGRKSEKGIDLPVDELLYRFGVGHPLDVFGRIEPDICGHKTYQHMRRRPPVLHANAAPPRCQRSQPRQFGISSALRFGG